ncbi:isoprenoid synthase domain-containing protein [Mycena belliarum]|uniref:Isoprenoid synthase domain-containing protein n=1 Tax=Mycena belliarum TaxID=1033014 RepID=A0AAD6XUS8_9AGAR|nr:isoprenoid synthase domain-containing protein [Mycena belliae]
MGLSTWLLMLVAHPKEFRTLMQYHIYHDQNRDITAPREHATSGWDRASMRRCWEFLDMTSRSFSAVIKELEGDLARVICIFYLVLRALDTIEDDMTLPASVKQPLLRAFHEHTLVPGFSFTGSGPDEKDAPLLVEYPVVVEELLRLPQVYRDAIVSITAKMGAGMADFALRADAALAAEKAGGFGLETAEEYDLYCHYVAGLVGEGLSLLFAASGKEAPSLGAQLELSNSMALLLQKTNITRDIAEDVAQRRYFWPRDMWGPAGARFGGGFARMEDVVAAAPVSAAAFVDEKAALRGAQPQALFVLSAMVVDTLRHAPDALDYLRLLKNQSIFNFCAIPASMAVATLELCFMNPEVLQRNVKIRKAVAASLIMRSTNPREVGLIFREYARKMHARALPSDPNFTRLSVACGKVCSSPWSCALRLPSSSLLFPLPASHPIDAVGAPSTRASLFDAPSLLVAPLALLSCPSSLPRCSSTPPAAPLLSHPCSPSRRPSSARCASYRSPSPHPHFYSAPSIPVVPPSPSCFSSSVLLYPPVPGAAVRCLPLLHPALVSLPSVPPTIPSTMYPPTLCLFSHVLFLVSVSSRAPAHTLFSLPPSLPPYVTLPVAVLGRSTFGLRPLPPRGHPSVLDILRPLPALPTATVFPSSRPSSPSPLRISPSFLPSASVRPPPPLPPCRYSLPSSFFRPSLPAALVSLRPFRPHLPPAAAPPHKHLTLTDTSPQIEQWCEHYYPSFINLSAAANGGPPAQSIDESDARGRTFAVSEKREAARAQRLRIEMLRAGIKPAVLEGRVPAQGMETSEIMMYVMATVLGVVGLIAGVVWLIMQVAD